MKQKFFFIQFLVLLLSPGIISAQDPLLDILEKELNREFSELKKQEIPTYFLSYRVAEQSVLDIYGSYGCLDRIQRNNTRQLTTMLRVGSPELDNFHELRGTSSYISQTSQQLPVLNDASAISQILWQSTNDQYFQAIQKLTQVKGNIAVNVAQEDKSPDFSEEPASQYIDKLMKTTIDKSTEENLVSKVRLYSKAFADSKSIFSCSVRFNINFERDYYVSSAGSKIAENHPRITLSVYGYTLSDDGMDMPLYKTYFANDLKELPKDETVLTDINELVKKLEALRVAPVVEPYSGPALLSGSATGVFFHEIFGHRVEAARMKSENDAQTFKNKVGQQVLNKNLTVVFDPTINIYKGFILNGSYKYDDEGVKGKRVTVVTKGILTDFLSSRTPIAGFLKSNGHGRAQTGLNPVARQSNLIVESDQILSEPELRKLFVEELKKQNIPFGYYFKEVSGGFTSTGRLTPNAFNVTPLDVYRVYSDGRPDEQVRGINLVGTPLAMFSEIEAVGGEYGLFTGICGAESGGVPVASVCPMMFVKKIEIQKKAKSTNTNPILDRPF
ncbi:MAG: TldD/PmbA family protein [Bacteroidia bacterium]|nr:TldD/PmbA family protein [Bacteroidia bacterium]